MTSAELRYMQLTITSEVGANLPGASLMEIFHEVEFLSHISTDGDSMRCLVRVQFGDSEAMDVPQQSFEVLKIIEQGSHAALLEVVTTGPLPGVFATLEHVWWVSPTYLNKDGMVITVRGTKESLRSARQGLSALLGDRYKMKLGAQSLHNTQFLELLPDKQRAVLDKAIELGYYDRPRRCTQRVIADALNIKQATVSEHLQSAESTIIHAFVNEP